MTDSSQEQSLSTKRLLTLIRRRAWIVILCVVIGGAAAYFVGRGETKKYSATAALLFQQNTLSQQLFGYSTADVISDPTTAQATDVSLASEPQVATITARHLRLSPSRVGGDIAVAPAGSSEVVNVTATDTSPAMAQRVANAYAQEFVNYRAAAERAQVVRAGSQLQAQIQVLRTGPGGVNSSKQIGNLETRLSQLQVLATLQTGDVQIAQNALLPTAPSSPNTHRDAELGALVGLILGLALAFLIERADQSLRDSDEAKRLLNLPVLGIVPATRDLARSGRRRTATVGSPGGEAFQLLRAQLRYFNVDRKIKTVLVSSAASGDGKSTVAWNLACAAVQLAPESSVLIVDADLRRPAIATAAGLPPSAGLAEMLSQDLTPEEAIRQVKVGPETAHGRPRVNVLTAGLAAPNPSELLQSDRLRRLVAYLKNTYDFVVFDAPPTSLVSDAIPLVRLVDGVLVIVRLRQTRRHALQRFNEQLMALEAPTLGLVLNAVSSDSQENYGYGAYRYSATAEPPPAPSEESDASAKNPAVSAEGRSSATDEPSGSDMESEASADKPPVKTT